MRLPLLRTLSSRIIVAFAVLIVAFGAVSALTVRSVGWVGVEVRVIQKGYFPLALDAQNLFKKQEDYWQYLRNEVRKENNAGRVQTRIRRYRQTRDQGLAKLQSILDGLSRLPPNHERRMRLTQMRLNAVREAVAALDQDYELLLASPPLDRRLQQTEGSDPQLTAASKALDRLTSRGEVVVSSQLRALFQDQERFVTETADSLGEVSSRLRTYALYLSLVAVFLGLLMTAWATITLRPLRRLADGARRIARGDYASRIEERGPSEVAELAHEFNSMGRAVEERERELVRSERLVAVGKMASMITHEVRNPLSSIGLNTELLVEELAGIEGAAGAEARSLCGSITTEIDRLTAITEEYLRFARLPKPKLAPEAVDRMVANLVDFEREQLAKREVRIEVDVPGDLPLVLCDDGQIRQSLLNLLRNAADAVEEVGGGRVIISARRSTRADDRVEIEVRDEGRGIDPEVAAKLFDPFFSTKTGGTGLGLALTEQIIREHGGSIEVDGGPGRGAVFVVSLPTAKVTALADARG